LQVGLPALAYTHLSTALAFHLDWDEARGLRARAAFRLGRWADTASDATLYLDQYPHGSGVGRDLFRRVNEYNHTGEGLERPPSRDDVQYLRGRAYQFLGRFEEAIADYTALLGKHSADARLYAWRARCLEALGRRSRAKADREQALIVATRVPRRCIDLARVLLIGPAEEQDAPLGLQLAKGVARAAPEDMGVRNTLGVALYRNARYAEAVQTLEKNLAARKGWNAAYDPLFTNAAYDLLFLAMSYARLGNAARAKDCFDQAVRWTAAQKELPPQMRAELRAFRAEAEEVLRASK
jgi:tetratricopeptide (TPR) repeat protein